MKGICLRSTLDILLWETPTEKGCLGSHKNALKKIKRKLLGYQLFKTGRLMSSGA